MNIGRVSLDTKWKLIEQVNDGNEYYIQNIPSYSGDVQFIVSETEPKPTDLGGVLPEKMQLKFKKINGDLYMRCISPFNNKEINIEQVEA